MSKPTGTKINFFEAKNDGVKFPTVTFCNFNRYNKSFFENPEMQQVIIIFCRKSWLRFPFGYKCGLRGNLHHDCILLFIEVLVLSRYLDGNLLLKAYSNQTKFL